VLGKDGPRTRDFVDPFRHELFEADFGSSGELIPLAITGTDRFREWLAHHIQAPRRGTGTAVGSRG
jgi:hypothetical protein